MDLGDKTGVLQKMFPTFVCTAPKSPFCIWLQMILIKTPIKQIINAQRERKIEKDP